MHVQWRPPRWLAAALACGLAAAWAQTAVAPPPWPHGDPPPVAVDPVHPLKLGAQRVVIGATTIADVQRAIGIGEATRHGKGTEQLDWLCYTVPDGEVAQRVWLTSSELAGGNKIDGVTAMELAAGEKATANCPELPAKFRPLRFDDGLWLGALGAEQRRALNVPAHGTTTWSGMYRATVGAVDAIGMVAVDVRRARAVVIHVAKN